MYVSTCTTFTHDKSSIVVTEPMDRRIGSDRHFDHCGNELDSLPQEDRVRKVSSSS